jgi:hypothetical protein
VLVKEVCWGCSLRMPGAMVAMMEYISVLDSQYL